MLYKKKNLIMQLLIICLRALLLMMLKSHITISSTTNYKIGAALMELKP